ncbi:hypothetical protein QH639_09075 [Lysinibacillus sp. 1 U-2021]|uniref:hypothetical protein n=1 Tax=Lysinibacillus sp. 1 U-2021 TaxID=3039426 RepID=UPI002480E2FD|nr:hypothetical protein [Lysinibacillus sp. 1 U-2021]WGT40906.1 hypothetical protein QH639_09075 [Lysinibacillus sp. 1 U-2021]
MSRFTHLRSLQGLLSDAKSPRRDAGSTPINHSAISRSQCAGQKNIAKSGAGTQNRIEVAGKKNAALFEWAAFVKAEK